MGNHIWNNWANDKHTTRDYIEEIKTKLVWEEQPEYTIPQGWRESETHRGQEEQAESQQLSLDKKYSKSDRNQSEKEKSCPPGIFHKRRTDFIVITLLST